MKYFVSITILLLASCAHSQNCENLDNMNEINICFGTQLTKLENQIKAIVSQYSDTLPKPNELKEAQSAWEKYRNLHCKNSARIFDGGTQFGLAVLQCKINMSKSRLSILEADYEIALNIIKNGSP